jgi:hypothetical protein
MAQLYFPAELAMLLATTFAVLKVAGVEPSSNVIVIVSLL